MTESASTLVGDILRACAAVAPEPWHPGSLLLTRSESRDDIIFCLDSLCRTGVLTMMLDEQNEVTGFTLTPRGVELANDPQASARFIEDERLDFSQPDSPQRRTVREMFRTPGKPLVNRVLFWLNIAVFAWGCYLASRQQVFGDFLNPMAAQGRAAVAVTDILRDTGMLSREDVAHGRWWRLLTCGFVHIGLLHLVMNMYALRILGADTEWIWGRWRYLVLYLLALLGGSCAAMIAAPAVGGASGGLCGLLAAEAAWLILNRNHLPRRLVRSQLRGLLINGVLIIGVSLLPRVSGAAHFGGAVVGLVVAVLLHYQRFGNALISRLAVVGLIAVPIVCVLGLKEMAARDPLWQGKMEDTERDRMRQLAPPIQETDREILRFSRDTLRPLLIGILPERRDEDGVKAALDRLPAQIRRAMEAEDQLSNTSSFATPAFEEYRLAGREYFRHWAAYLSRVQACLTGKKEWDSNKEEELLARAQQRWLKAKPGGPRER